MNAIIMTNSVIGQAANKEIAKTFCGGHTAAMPVQPLMLPEEARAAMDPKAIGARLKLLRMSQNMTPSEMADTLGIERTYWSRFEKGRRAITDPVAALLVLRFGVTLDFLILGRWDKLPFDLAETMRDIAANASTDEDLPAEK